MAELAAAPIAPPTVVGCAMRERTRDVFRRALPRRRARLVPAKGRDELLQLLKTTYVDVVVVDLGQSSDDAWAAAALAREFPSISFVAYAALRPAELPHLVRASQLEFAEWLVEGVEDAVLRELLAPLGFAARFAAALEGAEARVGLRNNLQYEAWRFLVAHGGRPVRTEAIADALHLTREHLSRRFSADGAPNLKRVIDLVRLLAASDLAKNPGYDLPDIARVLGFASASHLGQSCQRLLGVKGTSLARLRPTDLMDRFVKQGRGRSRTQ